MRLRTGHRKLLGQTVLVPADVGDDDGVLGQDGPHLSEDAAGMDRRIVEAGNRFQSLPPGVLLRHQIRGSRHLGQGPFLLARGDRLQQILEGRFGIGDDAHFGGIVLTDFRRINIDMDQPGGRNGEGIFWHPRGTVGLGEGDSIRNAGRRFGAGCAVLF